MDYQKVTDNLITFTRNKVKEANAKGVILGLSGGIDSAVVMVLCQKAFPDNCQGIIMPCHSDFEDAEDASLAANYFNFPVKEVDLSNTYDEIIKACNEESSNKMALANIKPRLRMTTLYYEAAIRNYLVVGTGNKSEIVIGYYTKYGDGGVDIEPIGSLVKTQVKELAKYLNVPDKVIIKEPTAGLWSGQTDEEEMGFTYEQLDKYILTGSTTSSAMEKIMKLEKISEHKKNMPPIALL